MNFLRSTATKFLCYSTLGMACDLVWSYYKEGQIYKNLDVSSLKETQIEKIQNIKK